MMSPYKCPNCGGIDKFDGVACPHCDYIWRYDDLANFGPEDYAFIVKFECRNCGNTFRRGFQENDSVWYDPPSIYDQVKIDSVNGNLLGGTINGKHFRPQCEVCQSDSSLIIADRTPISPVGPANTETLDAIEHLQEALTALNAAIETGDLEDRETDIEYMQKKLRDYINHI